MAEAVLQDIESANDLFLGKAVLSFAINKHNYFDWQWSGLREALSVQVPEKFGHELIDLYVKAFGESGVDYTFHQSFVESVRWRRPEHISSRTMDLLGICIRDNHQGFALMIEFCLRDEHPLNVDRLHKRLSSLKMPDRDALWTTAISWEFVDTEFDRLVRWAMTADKSRVAKRYLHRAANAVAWFLTSTCQYARDSATKALSSLYVDDPDIFLFLMKRFQEVDDPYLLERLYASAYGYLLRTYDRKSLQKFAAVAAKIFAGDSPPTQLYLRDYARSIVELAVAQGCYNGDVPIEHCRPPYKSKKPVFNATEQQVKNIADKAGNEAIVWSSSEMGDFKRYNLDPEIGKFIRIPIEKDVPLTPHEKMEQFEGRFADDSSVKEMLLQLSGRWFPEDLVVQLRSFDEADELTDKESADLESEIAAEKRRLKSEIRAALTDEEYDEFKRIWLPGNKLPYHKRKELPRFDLSKAGYWVARRAYGFGWNNKRFPDDRSRTGDYSRQRPGIERIGKKYQWLARSELLARLADNYWMGAEYSDEYHFIFNHPNDFGYDRDIDPSLFEHATYNESLLADLSPHQPPAVAIQGIDGPSRLDWPLQASPAKDYLSIRDYTAPGGEDWVRLHWHTSNQRRSEDKNVVSHGLLQREFCFINCVFMERDDAERLVDAVCNERHIDIPDYGPLEYTDHPYLYEYDQINVWPLTTSRLRNVHMSGFPEYNIIPATEEYGWESHLDRTLPNGFRRQVLSTAVANHFHLKIDSVDSRKLIAQDGSTASWYVDVDSDNSGLIMRRDLLSDFLQHSNLEILTVVCGEREAWTDGGRFGAVCYRRFNALQIGFDGKIYEWNEDTDQRSKATS